MHTETNPNNPHPATRFANSNFVSQDSLHLSSAMNAAEQVRYQYSKASKTKQIRECLDHLKAYIAFSNGVRP